MVYTVVFFEVARKEKKTSRKLVRNQMAYDSNVVIFVPQFSGESYCIWVVKMKSCLKSICLWDYVDQDKKVPPLQANPKIAQMKPHVEEKLKKKKAVSVLHSALQMMCFSIAINYSM